LGDQIKRNEMGRACSIYGGEVRKPEGKRSLERPRHRWEDHKKGSSRSEIVGGGAWIGVIWLRIATGGGLL
jgi:hypothetical protein